MDTPLVGLFGVCGASTWRAPFRTALQARGIPFFDPQVPEGTWHPGLVALEHRHLVSCPVLVWAITDETTAAGSLAETGFALLESLRSPQRRWLAAFLDPECRAPAAPEALADSRRARRLALSRLSAEADADPRVLLVPDLDRLLEATLACADLAARAAAITAETAALQARLRA